MKTASITKKWDFLWCVLFGIVFTACHIPFSTRSDTLESDKLITSTGSASTFGQAEQKVWADLKERIYEQLRGAPKKVIDQATELVLRNTHTSVNWFSSDRDRFIATARIDINSVLNNLVEQTHRDYSVYVQQFDQADKLLVDGSDGYGALQLTLKSLNNLSEIEQKITLIKALNHQAQLFIPAPTRDDIIKRVLNWISEIEIRTAFGNDQHLSSGQSLAMPIGFWIFWSHDGKPVGLEGLPIRFFVVGIDEKPKVLGTTNALGIASAHLSYIPRPGSSLMAGVDTDRIFSDANLPRDEHYLQDIRKRLAAIQTPFQWHLQDNNVLRVVIFINETIAKQLQAFDQSESVRAFMDILENEGYYLQVSSELPDDQQSYTPEQLAAYFRNRADIIVVGQVDSEVEQTVAEGLVFALAKGKIQVVNVLNGTVIGSFEDSSKGAGQDAYSAQMRSIINFSQKAKSTLLGTLRGQSTASSAP
jgi:hypothetical protein